MKNSKSTIRHTVENTPVHIVADLSQIVGDGELGDGSDWRQWYFEPAVVSAWDQLTSKKYPDYAMSAALALLGRLADLKGVEGAVELVRDKKLPQFTKWAEDLKLYYVNGVTVRALTKLEIGLLLDIPEPLSEHAVRALLKHWVSHVDIFLDTYRQKRSGAYVYGPRMASKVDKNTGQPETLSLEHTVAPEFYWGLYRLEAAVDDGKARRSWIGNYQTRGELLTALSKLD